MQRPWNKTPLPVYSLVTCSQENVYNMNICTYVVPISMKPKRYLISLDPHTKTYENFMQNTSGILQILSKNCKRYVKTLGKTSGNTYNKCEILKKNIIFVGNIPILRDVVAYLEIEKIEYIPQNTGDHHLFVVEVKKYSYINPQENILSTDDLYTS